MTNEYTVKILSAANDRLFTHLEFLARVSEPAARRLYREILDDIESLQTNPERFSVYPTPDDIPGVYRSMPSGKRYRIVYRILGHTVYIGDIQDCRQSIDRHLV